MTFVLIEFAEPNYVVELTLWSRVQIRGTVIATIFPVLSCALPSSRALLMQLSTGTPWMVATSVHPDGVLLLQLDGPCTGVRDYSG